MRILADSGAWSHFRSGKKLTMDDYCKWLDKWQHAITHYVNMDVIGDGQKSYDNWIEMRKRGYNPLPVYHASTSIKFLEKYLESGADYLCLGAIARMNTEYRISNLDLIWANHLVEHKTGMPIVKVHGFGLTSLRIMVRYPWYSVDSTSWAYAARNGMMFIARKIGGEFKYGEQSYKRFVSTRSPRSKKLGGEHHIDACSQNEKDLFKEYLSDLGVPYGKSTFRPYTGTEVLAGNELLWKRRVHIGKGTPLIETIHEKGICNDQRIRNEANILFFLKLSKQIRKWPWPFHAHKTQRRIYS